MNSYSLKKNLKLLRLGLFVICLVPCAQGRQHQIELKIDNGQLWINGEKFSESASIKKWQECLGPGRQIIKDDVYLWSELGIQTYNLNNDSAAPAEVNGMSVHLRESPVYSGEQTFKHKFYFNGTWVDSNSTIEEINKNLTIQCDGITGIDLKFQLQSEGVFSCLSENPMRIYTLHFQKKAKHEKHAKLVYISMLM